MLCYSGIIRKVINIFLERKIVLIFLPIEIFQLITA